MDPFCYSNDNKNNTFDNGGNKGHRLENITCKHTSNGPEGLKVFFLKILAIFDLCFSLQENAVQDVRQKGVGISMESGRDSRPGTKFKQTSLLPCNLMKISTDCKNNLINVTVISSNKYELVGTLFS